MEVKTFKWINLPRKLEVAERVETDTVRLYRTPEGAMYPSVTSILGVKPKLELEAWKQAVGIEEANRISKRATTRGTIIHDLCERYLKNEEIDFKKYNPLDVNDWRSLKKVLDDSVDNIMSTEMMMYSDRLQAAGTADLIAEWKGKLCLLDFKTSTGWKHESQIEDYFIQTTAYCMMAYERLGIVLQNIVILMAVDGGEVLVFEKKAADYMHKFFQVRKMFRDENGY